MSRFAIVALVALLAVPSVATGQDRRAYFGGSATVVTQTESDEVPLGGTTWGGSVLFGVEMSPRLAIEFETLFGGPYSWEYSYRPSPALTADVVVTRRDTFFSGQARIRLGVIEPVLGLSYVHGRIGRHATLGNTNTVYFDDSDSDGRVALVAGLDAAVPLSPHVYFVPTFRVFAAPVDSPGNPLGDQTSTGTFSFRYGAGLRIRF